MEVVKVLSTNVAAGANISGFAPYEGLDFFSDQVQIFYSGLNMLKGSVPGPDIDVYPGTNPNSGDIKFTRSLVAGEVVKMVTTSPFRYLACLVAPQYELTPDKHLEVFVWGEQNGQRVVALTASLKLFLDGTLVRDYGSTGIVDARGMFKFEEVDRTLVRNRNYVLEASLVFELGADPVVCNRTFINY